MILNRTYSSELEKQSLYLGLLNDIGRLGLTSKEVSVLSAICVYSAGTRALTNTVKQKARALLGDSSSSFSNTLRSIINKGVYIKEDIINKRLYAPVKLEKIEIRFNAIERKDSQGRQETEPDNNVHLQGGEETDVEPSASRD